MKTFPLVSLLAVGASLAGGCQHQVKVSPANSVAHKVYDNSVPQKVYEDVQSMRNLISEMTRGMPMEVVDSERIKRQLDSFEPPFEKPLGR